MAEGGVIRCPTTFSLARYPLRMRSAARRGCSAPGTAVGADAGGRRRASGDGRALPDVCGGAEPRRGKCGAAPRSRACPRVPPPPPLLRTHLTGRRLLRGASNIRRGRAAGEIVAKNVQPRPLGRPIRAHGGRRQRAGGYRRTSVSSSPRWGANRAAVPCRPAWRRCGGARRREGRRSLAGRAPLGPGGREAVQDAVDRHSDHRANTRRRTARQPTTSAMPTGSSPIYSSADELHFFVWRLKTGTQGGLRRPCGMCQGTGGERVAGSSPPPASPVPIEFGLCSPRQA